MKKSKQKIYEYLLKVKQKQYEQLETKLDLMQLSFTEEMLQMLGRNKKRIKALSTAEHSNVKRKLYQHLVQASDWRYQELEARYSALKTLSEQIVTVIHKTSRQLDKIEEVQQPGI